MKALKSILYSLIVLLVLFSSASAAPLLQEPPEILYVKQEETGECSSWEDACDLQTAIGKLPDQIWVAAGTYIPTTTGDRSISFKLESGLKIYGGFPAEGGTWEDRDWNLHPTILSGDLDGDDGEDFANNEENSYHVLTATDVNRLARLDGFIITGGNADGEYKENQYGAGMYNTSGSNPILTNLKFTGNHSYYYGSALYNDQSNPALTHVSFAENEGDVMYNISSNPTLIDVQFIKNGMGMYNSLSNPTLFDVAFVENAPYGGMYNEVSSATLTEVTFFGNSGCKGGGMYNTPDPSNPSNIALKNVSFIGNTAVGGGGIYNFGYGLHTTLINVTFSGNHAILGSSDCPGLNPDSGSGFYGYGYGGGVANRRSSMTMTNVTFSENTADNNGDGVSVGAGLYLEQNIGTVDSFVDITNCVFWENSPDTDQVVFVGNNPPAFTYSVIQGGCPTGATCEDIITDDPLLGPLADNGGFTQTHALLPGSSAIDAGNSDPAVCPDTDQRGVARPIGNGCDIGAYEFAPMIFLPLIIK